MKYQILQGDNRETLKTIPDNSIDAIVTDPPYGIDFLGKAWDANTGALETYQECLRVLKPGGHILAFSAARTYHHLAVTLEQAGFEIRDQIMWIYSSGFPKSQDIGKSIQRSLGVKETIPTDPEAKQWAGWGTALKPAHEPIALARKPIKLSIAKNAQKYGVGALNIDATRVKADDLQEIANWHARYQYTAGSKATFNNILSEAQGKERQQHDGKQDSIKAQEDILKGRFPSNVIGEILQADYQKYYYCPKVSRKERHIGHETPPPMFGDVQGAYGPDGNRMAVGFDNRDIATEASMLADMGGYYVDDNNTETKVTGKNIWLPQTGRIYVHGLKDEYQKWCKANNKTPNVGNNHPTVKPIELMKYLIKLITPPGGTVLDPFNGSGSTGCAAVELGFEYIGCELDPAYVAITERRIAAWLKKDSAVNNFEDLFSGP